MKAIKCGTCSQLHGGFHLCSGDERTPVRRQFGRSTRMRNAESQRQRWAKRHLETRDRDLAVCDVYSRLGKSLRETGVQFGLSASQVRNILLRLGTEIRPSNSEKNKVR